MWAIKKAANMMAMMKWTTAIIFRPPIMAIKEAKDAGYRYRIPLISKRGIIHNMNSKYAIFWSGLNLFSSGRDAARF